MEYPGARFKRPLRLFMLFFFVVAFFTISPTVILYSAGYRYDFKNGLLREVGSLSVDIFPENASVYLDGLKLKEKMPIRLNNITPHKYSLKISAPDYYDWEKQIEVRKNQTTYIKEITLLKKDKPVLVSKGKIGNVSISDSGRYLAYVLDNKIMIQNLATENISAVLTINSENQLKLSWAPLSDHLIVSTDKSPYEKLFVVDPLKPRDYKNILDVYPEVNKYTWKNSPEPEIYLESKKKIYSYLPRINQSRQITEIKGYFDWYLNDGSLWTITLNTSTKELVLSEDALGFNTTFSTIPSESKPEDLNWELITVERGTVLLKNNLTNQFQITRRDKNFTVNGNKHYVSKFNNWLLIWSESELWTYSEGEDPFLLNRPGEAMLDIKPLDQFNTLAIQWDHGVTALFPYYYNDETIIDKQVKSMAVNPEERTLYYSNSSGLWKLNY